MNKEHNLQHNGYLNGTIKTSALTLQWCEAPWDTAVFGTPVIQITQIEVRGNVTQSDLKPFIEARERSRCALVSCRLADDHLRESMLLEDIGFKFIEMLFQPELSNLPAHNFCEIDALDVRRAQKADMADIIRIAGCAFGNERFHMDPRLPMGIGDLRYQQWVRNSANHPRQRLYALRDENKLVAFFVTEDLPDRTCYWHLNAVAPTEQGKGYGERAWHAMLQLAQKAGAERVKTSIAARNNRVLNLYARLGFSFNKPLMTLHWVPSL